MANNLLSNDLDQITDSLLLHEESLVGISNSLKNYTVQNKSYLDNQKQFIELLPKVQVLYTKINDDAKKWHQSLEKTIKFQEETYPVIFNDIQKHIQKQQDDFIAYFKVLEDFDKKHQIYIQRFKKFEEKHIDFFSQQQKDFEKNGVNKLIKEQLTQNEQFNNFQNEQFNNFQNEMNKFQNEKFSSLQNEMSNFQNEQFNNFQNEMNKFQNGKFSSFQNEMNNFKEMLLEIKTSQFLLLPNKKVIWYKRVGLFFIMIFLLYITPNQIKNFFIYIWKYFTV